jgi:putative membrane protein insertion efficiency factor
VNPVQHILIFAIRAHRLTISPAQSFLFGPTGGCRFTPTCSQYAMDAIREHGVMAGSWLAVKRICRCHPWGRCGHDPVPGKEFGVRPSALRFDAASIKACRAGAEGEGGSSEFGI